MKANGWLFVGVGRVGKVFGAVALAVTAACLPAACSSSSSQSVFECTVSCGLEGGGTAVVGTQEVTSTNDLQAQADCQAAPMYKCQSGTNGMLTCTCFASQ